MEDTVTNGNKAKASLRLLDRFQGYWEQIHSNSVNNVDKAKFVIKQLNRIEQSCLQRSEALYSFIQNYKSIGDLNQQIDIITCDIQNLERCFTQLEESLLELKILKERTVTEDYVTRVEADYEAQVRDQKALSEVRRDRLMSEHLERVQAFDREQLRALEEKRRILDKEFQEDKNRYLANKPPSQR